MTALDWTPIIVSLLSGGGLIGLWIQRHIDHKKNLEVRRKEAKALEAATEQKLQENAGLIIQNMFDRHTEEFTRSGKRLDALENRNNELADRNDKLVTDLAQSHKQLRHAEMALIDTERKLVAAEQERDRKERVIIQLQEQIHILENTISELRAQVEQLTQALAECARREPGEEPCPLLERTSIDSND